MAAVFPKWMKLKKVGMTYYLTIKYVNLPHKYLYGCKSYTLVYWIYLNMGELYGLSIYESYYARLQSYARLQNDKDILHQTSSIWVLI